MDDPGESNMPCTESNTTPSLIFRIDGDMNSSTSISRKFVLSSSSSSLSAIVSNVSYEFRTKVDGLNRTELKKKTKTE